MDRFTKYPEKELEAKDSLQNYETELETNPNSPGSPLSNFFCDLDVPIALQKGVRTYTKYPMSNLFLITNFHYHFFVLPHNFLLWRFQKMFRLLYISQNGGKLSLKRWML